MERETLGQQEIKKKFYKYYAKLFEDELSDKKKIEEYLNNCDLPRISLSIKEMLNKKVIQEEVEKAIDEIKMGKALGPDCLAAKIYKINKFEIRTYLQHLMNGIKLRLKKYCYKYRVFADNIMFIMEHPNETFPKLFGDTKEFAKLAGFYINVKKTKIMCKNRTKKARRVRENNWV